MLKKIGILFLLVCSTTGVFAQELLPFVENFSKTHYRGDNQVWSIAQGNDHALYFANNHYLLRYNGVVWEKYTLPNKTIIRSVYAEGNRIYTGSYTEFGYWERHQGRMQYTSLSAGKNLFTGLSSNEEIWKIFGHQGKIYFQSFNEIYVYHQGRIAKTRSPHLLSYCFVAGDQVYAASVKEGIFRFEQGKFKPVPQWDVLKNNVVHALQTHGNSTYIFTQMNGIWVDKAGALRPWNHPLNAKLKTETIVSAAITNSNTLVIGTAFQGVYLVDMHTGNYRCINRSNGLKNNTVLSIVFDRENDLWLGLDNGISHLEINSPIQLFTDPTGILGSVYAVSETPHGYLIGSNHGAFTLEQKKLALLPGTQGQVWDIYRMANRYVIGHNDATFVYENGKINKANSISGGWKFIPSSWPNLYFQAHYSGIIRYTNPVDLSEYHELKGITQPIKNIAQVHPKEMWAVDNYRGLYRISLDEQQAVKRITNITAEQQITNDYGVKLLRLHDEVLFYIDDTWYYYDSIARTLRKHAVFNQHFRNCSDIIPIDDQHFMVLRDQQLFVIEQVGDRFIWNLLPEKYYAGKIINQDIKLYRSGNRLIMNLDDGFLQFQLKNPPVHQSRIEIEAFSNGKRQLASEKVPFNQPLTLHLISSYYGFKRNELYYSLDRPNTTHPTGVKSGQIVLNNLESGSHTIYLYASNGESYVPLRTYEFEVALPWYFSLWMFIAYVVVIGLLVGLYYRWNKLRYRERLKRKEEEILHQNAILKLEMERENTLKMQAYEREILELQIATKANELAEKSFSIAKQGELIENIQTVLEKETEVSAIKTQIRKVIKAASLNRNEWDNFEKNLLQSNQEFVQRLTARFPTLTPKDIRLSIYLKMNMSSKEIAPLMKITYRGVELHRYRLRKKLQLGTEENLYKFMISL